MQGPHQYPPPGVPGGQWAAPGTPPQPGPAGPYPGFGPPPPRPPAPVVHRPGAVPLRPLGLGDILDASVRIVRHNAGATVGASLLVGALSMLVPVLTTLLVWSTTGLAGSLDPNADVDTLANDELLATLGVLLSWLAGFVVQYLGIVLVTGMVVQVTAAAATGRRLTLGEAWDATAGRRWRLVGLVLLLGTVSGLALTAWTVLSVIVAVTGPVLLVVGWFCLTVPLLVAGAVWFWIKVAFLPAAVLVVEDLGVLASIRRGSALVTGHFWRILGIAVLVNLLAQLAGGILAMPLAIMGVLPPLMGASPEVALLVSVGTQVLSVVVVTALTTPFLAATTALVHLDLRIRKEAYDVELIQQAGIGRP